MAITHDGAVAGALSASSQTIQARKRGGAGKTTASRLAAVTGVDGIAVATDILVAMGVGRIEIVAQLMTDNQ